MLGIHYSILLLAMLAITVAPHVANGATPLFNTDNVKRGVDRCTATSEVMLPGCGIAMQARTRKQGTPMSAWSLIATRCERTAAPAIPAATSH